MKRKLLIGLCLSLIALFGCKGKLTSDDELAKRFYAHRANFETLVRMMNEDTRVTSVYYEDIVLLEPYSIWRSDDQEGFSTERWNKYKELFPQLGSASIRLISRNGDAIEIAPASVVVYDTNDSYESVVTSKGYVYALKEPSPLVESLDNRTAIPCYKKIEGNWYLYYDSGVSKPE